MLIFEVFLFEISIYTRRPQPPSYIFIGCTLHTFSVHRSAIFRVICVLESGQLMALIYEYSLVIPLVLLPIIVGISYEKA
jgi:hypothetical protein